MWGDTHNSVQKPWLAKVGDQSRKEEVLLQTLNKDTNRTLPRTPPSQVPHTGEQYTESRVTSPHIERAQHAVRKLAKAISPTCLRCSVAEFTFKLER